MSFTLVIATADGVAAALDTHRFRAPTKRLIAWQGSLGVGRLAGKSDELDFPLDWRDQGDSPTGF
jgi:hypothetical protein